ncbi:MAG: hypothetical protein ACT4PT_11170, partial [Methanobacteriota archaeon]
LLSIIQAQEISPEGSTTGEVYDLYTELSKVGGMDQLTQRRITDLISELDMLGIVNARVISKGRYGRTKEIELSVPLAETKQVLKEDPILASLPDIRPGTGSLAPIRQVRLV